MRAGSPSMTENVTFTRVALHGCHGGHDFNGIHAAVDVLAFEFLFGTIYQRLVERATVGQTNL